MQPLLSSLCDIESFSSAFHQLISPQQAEEFERQSGVRFRRRRRLSFHQLLKGLVFHHLNAGGYLSRHVCQMSEVKISDSALSQRRAAVDQEVFKQDHGSGSQAAGQSAGSSMGFL